MLPSLVCDLQHDRVKSDKILFDLAQTKRNKGQPRQQWSGPNPPSIAAIRAEQSRSEEQVIEQVKKLMFGKSEINEDETERGKTATCKHEKFQKGPDKDAHHKKRPSTSPRKDSSKLPSSKSCLRWSSTSVFTSSSSSSDEDLAMYESGKGMFAAHTVEIDDAVQDQDRQAPSPISGPQNDNNQGLDTNPSGGGHSSQTSAVANSCEIDFSSCAPQQLPVGRAHSI